MVEAELGGAERVTKVFSDESKRRGLDGGMASDRAEGMNACIRKAGPQDTRLVQLGRTHRSQQNAVRVLVASRLSGPVNGTSRRHSGGSCWLVGNKR